MFLVTLLPYYFITVGTLQVYNGYKHEKVYNEAFRCVG